MTDTKITEFLLPRSGQAPLKFRGAKVAAADGSWQSGRKQNRWHELVIYRTDDGRYVVRIAYSTRWEGECDHDAAEVVADVAEVGRLLAEYDPIEHLAGFPPGEQYAGRQAKLAADVHSRYQALVTEVLGAEMFAVDLSAAVYGADVRSRRLALCRRLEIELLGLTRNECCAICDALNGTVLDDFSWQSIWAEVADADRLDGLGQKWSIDAQALAGRLRDSSPGAKLAVAEAAEEFWRVHVDSPIDDGLRAVGLLPADGRMAGPATR